MTATGIERTWPLDGTFYNDALKPPTVRDAVVICVTPSKQDVRLRQPWLDGN